VTGAVTGGNSTGGGAGLTSGVSVEVGQEEAAVDLTVAVEYGVSIPQTTQAIRDNVINRVENLTGLRVTEVNITVNDVQFPEERPQLGRQQEVERRPRSRSGALKDLSRVHRDRILLASICPPVFEAAPYG
jgi:uncharacterized alkaline shock family protein YloU